MADRRYHAAGGVIFHRGQMLLLTRPSRNEIRLPKGHIEEGESHAVAALREASEESGYADLEIAADLGTLVVEFDYGGRHVIRTETYYLMRLRSERQAPRPPKDAAQFQLQWVAASAAPDLLTFDDERTFARRALEALSIDEAD